MPSGTVSITAQAESHVWSQSLTDTGGGYEKHVISLPAALAGSSVNGGSGSSVITLAAGHGLTTASVVTVGWVGGKRIGMTVSAYDGTTITVTNSTGSGDAYPAGTVACTVCTATTCADIAFDGDNAEFLLITSDQRSAVQFLDSGSAVLYTREITSSSDGYYWSLSSGVTKPITGNPVASASAYNLAAAAATMTISNVMAS